jgi:hypothetical protein
MRGVHNLQWHAQTNSEYRTHVPCVVDLGTRFNNAFKNYSVEEPESSLNAQTYANWLVRIPFALVCKLYTIFWLLLLR